MFRDAGNYRGDFWNTFGDGHHGHLVEFVDDVRFVDDAWNACR